LAVGLWVHALDGALRGCAVNCASRQSVNKTEVITRASAQPSAGDGVCVEASGKFKRHLFVLGPPAAESRFLWRGSPPGVRRIQVPGAR